MLVLLVEYIFLTTFYGLYFNHQLHITLNNFFKLLHVSWWPSVVCTNSYIFDGPRFKTTVCRLFIYLYKGHLMPPALKNKLRFYSFQFKLGPQPITIKNNFFQRYILLVQPKGTNCILFPLNWNWSSSFDKFYNFIFQTKPSKPVFNLTFIDSECLLTHTHTHTQLFLPKKIWPYKFLLSSQKQALGY